MSKFRIVIEKEIPHGVGQRVMTRIQLDHDMALRDVEINDWLNIKILRIEFISTLDPRLYIRFNGDAIGVIINEGNSIKLIMDTANGCDRIACLFATRLVDIIDSVTAADTKLITINKLHVKKADLQACKNE